MSLGGLLTEEEENVARAYLLSVKRDPILYLNPVYMELYELHPEVKQITSWKNVQNDQLQHNKAYKDHLQQSANVFAYILRYLEAPGKAYSIYYAYGKELNSRGFSKQYFMWYQGALSEQIKYTKEYCPALVKALGKLHPYTYKVVEEALGKKLKVLIYN